MRPKHSDAGPFGCPVGNEEVDSVFVARLPEMRRPTLVWLSPVLFALSACASVIGFDPAGIVDAGIGRAPGVAGQGGDDPNGAGGAIDSSGGFPPNMGSGGMPMGTSGTPGGPAGSTGLGGRGAAGRGAGGATGSGGQFIQPIGQSGSSSSSGGRRGSSGSTGSCSLSSCPACNVAQGPACCTPAGKCGCPLFWIPGTCG
jgi:hypothetical protein